MRDADPANCGIIHECDFDLINQKNIPFGSGALILMASIVSQCYKLTESSTCDVQI